MRRAFIAAVVVLGLAASAPFAVAQQQPAGEMPTLIENVEVRVINVDVVVTDKKGNVIKGLKKDDFEIYENSVRKPISNFFEVVGDKAVSAVYEAAPATPGKPAEPVRRDETESTRRRIIFFIDNLSLAPFNRNRVFNQMKDFVKTVMRPGDEAMIATFNRSMKTRVSFTRDPIQIIQTLDAIAGETAMGLSNRSERTQAEDRIRDARSYDEAIAIARSYAASVEHDLRQSVSSLNALMTTLAGVEGKKVLVLTSEGFPIQPGREMFYYVEEHAREKQWQTAGTLLEGMHYDSTQLIQQVARTANANNITMYTVHAAGLSGGNEFSAENRMPVSITASHAAMTNSTDSMHLMANMTGGVASVGTNNFKAAFERIQKDLESYYSLGYRAGTERVDRQRYLSVKMKNRAYVARARQTFVEKSMYAEMSDRVIANLLYRSKANPMNILARVGTPRATDDGLFMVPLEVQIPMESLTLLPQGDSEFAGGFEVYVAVADQRGDMSDVSRKSHPVRIPAADMPKTKGKYYSYSMDMLMEKGLNRISVGVVDNVSNSNGFALEQIMAKDLR